MKTSAKKKSLYPQTRWMLIISNPAGEIITINWHHEKRARQGHKRAIDLRVKVDGWSREVAERCVQLHKVSVLGANCLCVFPPDDEAETVSIQQGSKSHDRLAKRNAAVAV